MLLPDKVVGIKNIAVPITKKQKRNYKGLLNDYRHMWQHRSEILTPLSSMISKQIKWNWSKEYQKAFDTMKKLVFLKKLCFHANFNKPFKIPTDTSKLQLGLVISQKSHSIAFYSRNAQSYGCQLYYHRMLLVCVWKLSICDKNYWYKSILIIIKIEVFKEKKGYEKKSDSMANENCKHIWDHVLPVRSCWVIIIVCARDNLITNFFID